MRDAQQRGSEHSQQDDTERGKNAGSYLEAPFLRLFCSESQLPHGAGPRHQAGLAVLAVIANLTAIRRCGVTGSSRTPTSATRLTREGSAEVRGPGGGPREQPPEGALNSGTFVLVERRLEPGQRCVDGVHPGGRVIAAEHDLVHAH